MNLTSLICSMLIFLLTNYLLISIYQHSYYQLRRSLLHLVDRFKTLPIPNIILLLTHCVLLALYHWCTELEYALLFEGLLLLIITTKGTLRITKRSLRLLIINTVLVLLAVPFLLHHFPKIFFILYPILPALLLLLAIGILAPIEYYWRCRFFASAKKKINSCHNLTVIGLTGSYGKTTTKNFLLQFLQDLHPLVPPGNINTPLGVAKFINECLTPLDRFLILELGIDEPKGMRRFNFLTLDVAMITAVGAQHLRTFKNVENILKAKSAIANLLKPNGTIYYDESIDILKDRKDIHYHPIKNADYAVYLKKEDFELIHIDDALIKAPFTSSRITGDSVLAYTVAKSFQSSDRLKTIFQTLALPPRRKRVINLDERVIIDDSYNINPHSFQEALASLLKLEGDKLVITGGLFEIDQDEKLLTDFLKKLNSVERIIFIRRITHLQKRIIARIPGLKNKVLTERSVSTALRKTTEKNVLLLTIGDQYSLR